MSNCPRYHRVLFAGAFEKFAWARDLTVGVLLNLATLLLSYHFGLITLGEWNGHKWLFVLAIVLPYVVIFIPHILWKIYSSAAALHGGQLESIRRLQSERESVENKLKEIEETKPNIVLREPGARHIEAISLNDGRVVVLTAHFIKVRFVNRPTRNSPMSIAREVSAKIKFFDENDQLVLEMDGRWDDSDQPTLRHHTLTRRDLLLTEFGIEGEHNLDIAFLDPKTNEFVAFNNDNYNYQAFRKPEHILRGRKFRAEMRLIAAHVDVTYSVEFATSGLRGNARILGERSGYF